MNWLKEIQSYLSFGYVYLVALGVLSETTFYRFFDIDILKYSGISDILLSPITRLTATLYNPLIFLAFLFITFWIPNYYLKNRHKKWVKKSIKLEKPIENYSDNQLYSMILKSFMMLLAIGLFCFFAGFALGKGHKLSNLVVEQNLEYKDKIEFINGETKDVKIIGSNNAFIFYAEKGTTTVKVTPIQGLVKSIEEN